MGKGVQLKFEGIREMLQEIEQMGGSVDETVTATMTDVANKTTKKLAAGIKRHHRTGRTADALNQSPSVESNGNVFSVETGFSLPKGLPARYINYGTPTNHADPFLTKATDKAAYYREVSKALKQIIDGGR